MSRDELEWSKNELRNCLRAIEWDLEDLQETISILQRERERETGNFREETGRDTDRQVINWDLQKNISILQRERQERQTGKTDSDVR